MKQSLGRRHAAEIDSCQDRREGSIDEGAIYDDVDVVKAIAKDGRSDRDRNGRDQGYENRIPGPLEPEGCVYHCWYDVCEEEANNCCCSSVSEPFDLLAFYPFGPAQAYEQGYSRRNEQNRSHGVGNRSVGVGEAIYPQWISDRTKTLYRTRSERTRDHSHQDKSHGQPR